MDGTGWHRVDPAAAMPAVALAALLAVVSWHTASNLGGVAAAVAYAVVITATTLLGVPRATERLRAAAPGTVLLLAASAVLALVTAFVLGVPATLADELGVGSDRSNALDVALTRLADGAYPYTATTYLGHPISPLPGALLLAAPFWAITGDAATQNVAWVVLLLVVLRLGDRSAVTDPIGVPPMTRQQSASADDARPTLVWLLVVLGGLEVLREFLVGDDLALGTVPALAAVVAVLRAATHRSTPPTVLAAVALGVATCTRPHLVLLLVVVAAAVGAIAGRRRALITVTTAGLTWVVLVAPFLLGGVERFSPLHVAAKVTGDRAVTVGIVATALLAAVLVGAALTVVRPATPAAVGWLCAAVLAAPSALSWGRGVLVGPMAHVDLTLGAAAVPFAAWALASRSVHPPVGGRAERLLTRHRRGVPRA